MPRPQPIPRSLAKKRKPSAADGLPEGMEGLSDSERELLSRMVGKKAPEPERETVPKADHDREVASLNERISKLESKIEEIQKDKAKVVEERDSARRSLETARARVEELEGKLESKSSDLRAASERIARLETKVSSLESDRGIISMVQFVECRVDSDAFGMRDQYRKQLAGILEQHDI